MNPVENRKHIRIDSLNLSYICLDEDCNMVKQGMGRTLNISESGILLESYFPIEADHHILLSIGLEDKVVDVAGRLIHSRSTAKKSFEVGIEFIDLDAAALRTLKEFIARITA
jgi:hypothetical protein